MIKANGTATIDSAPAMQLFEALTADQHGSDGTMRCWTGDRFESATWREAVADAHGIAANLRRAGVLPGTRVATVLTNSPDPVRATATAKAGVTLHECLFLEKGSLPRRPPARSSASAAGSLWRTRAWGRWRA